VPRPLTEARRPSGQAGLAPPDPLRRTRWVFRKAGKAMVSTVRGVRLSVPWAMAAYRSNTPAGAMSTGATGCEISPSNASSAKTRLNDRRTAPWNLTFSSLVLSPFAHTCSTPSGSRAISPLQRVRETDTSSTSTERRISIGASPSSRSRKLSSGPTQIRGTFMWVPTAGSPRRFTISPRALVDSTGPSSHGLASRATRTIELPPAQSLRG
jgi:hypothetical protein